MVDPLLRLTHGGLMDVRRHFCLTRLVSNGMADGNRQKKTKVKQMGFFGPFLTFAAVAFPPQVGKGGKVASPLGMPSHKSATTSRSRIRKQPKERAARGICRKRQHLKQRLRSLKWRLPPVGVSPGARAFAGFLSPVPEKCRRYLKNWLPCLQIGRVRSLLHQH
jgi:hypothetical protein